LGLALDESKTTDEIIETGKLKLVIDKELLEQTGGVCVDYVERGFFKGYRVDPKVPLEGAGGGSHCGGCG